jgi:DNA-binding NarL/FixJ family response regulator
VAKPRAYFLGPKPETEEYFDSILRAAGFANSGSSAELHVGDVAKAAPSFFLVDFVDLDVDQLESLRQVRFVLPECVIAVYSEEPAAGWARECHLAGANAMLSKSSNRSDVSAAIKRSIRSGCYTDPNFKE